MRPALLLGPVSALVSAWAITACQDPGEGSKAVATAAAGKVVDVAGTVTAGGKPLALGDAIASDAVIDTGADGHVVIVLAHNLARWELGPNKHIRATDSNAWGLARATAPAKQVEQAMTAAGRDAERSAADTTTSGGRETAHKPTPALRDTAPELPPKTVAPDIAGLKGQPIEDAFGGRGLGLSGIGEGGGGRGEGIGLGTIGTIGHGAGSSAGFGTGRGRLGGGSAPKAPTLRAGQTQVNGSLPPEVIQRIVRQNFGRFRLCYEHGLQKNPALAGKIAVKFVIDRAGAVTAAVDGGSDLPDQDVVACVVRGFTGLAFPAPEGGIVNVVYPIVFQP